MNHLRTDGLVVYIDNDINEIMKRCHKMKIDRVVGMSTKTFSEILDYRREIYEKYYDYRVLVANNESVEEIATNVSHILNKQENYVDIFNLESERLLFENILEEGNKNKFLFPEKVSKLSLGQLERLVTMNPVERFTRILEFLPLGNVRPQNLVHHFNLKSLEDKAPFINLGHNVNINLSNCNNLLVKDQTPFTIILSKLPTYLNLYLDLVKSQKFKMGTKVDLSVKDDFFYSNSFSDISAFALSKQMGIPYGTLNLIDSKNESSIISSIAKEMKKSNTFLSLLYLISGDLELYKIVKQEGLSEEDLHEILQHNSNETECRIFIN